MKSSRIKILLLSVLKTRIAEKNKPFGLALNCYFLYNVLAKVILQSQNLVFLYYY